MGFDFSKYPQQPLYIEDRRSPEEKEASAKLLNERRMWIALQRIGVGILIGMMIGVLLGAAFL